MSIIVHRESAKIYQFPRRNELGVGNRRNGKAAIDPRLQPAAGITFGAWYHDAAIEEEQRGRKS